MKSIFLSKAAKIAVDILLIAGIFLSFITAHLPASAWWGSLHCISSMAWYALMIVHIWQHWRMTKAIIKWKALKRNKITFLTLAVFLLMTVSIIIFIAGVNYKTVHVHHVISKLFQLVIIIHTIQKAKRFISLFK